MQYKSVPNWHPVTENKITTDSPDYQFSKTVLTVHLHQAQQTQTTVVPEN